MNESRKSISILSCEPIDLEQPKTLVQLCREYTVHAEWIVSLVDEGILSPQGEKQEQWLFPGNSCYRISVVVRLQRDLGVNLAGAALALDLLEELQILRQRLHK
ncbi:MAG TPA: MerR family transcriptional regulator [Gammaproteobacteria bacterium]|nr:MerR family transcriptional regulator [Gammaproteobacteria bacterium]